MFFIASMKTKLWAIILMFLCTGLTSTAQLFYKLGAGHLTLNPLDWITNYYLMAGIGLYAIGAIILITAFRGGDITVLYPIIATSYIWVSLLSMVFLGEIMNTHKWIGIASIIIGIIFVGFGSRHKEVIVSAEAA